MKVYVLSFVWQCDSGECGSDVSVYETIEIATKAFKLLMKQSKQDFKYLDTEQSKYVKGDMSWSIWEKENYCYNHINITIKECEIINK